MNITCYPVTPERWDDLVELFAGHGNPGYCWCQSWRLSGRCYQELDSEGRRARLHEQVLANVPVGILAYQDSQPVGWCSVAPRETYGKLVRARSIQRVDDRSTWSIVCFYLRRSVRGQGLSRRLIACAVDYARQAGAEVLEAYPVEPAQTASGEPDYNVSYRFMGFVSMYTQAGFRDVTPAGSQRRVLRYDLGG
jgi:GNAT superfamily N-acetyltransferase